MLNKRCLNGQRGSRVQRVKKNDLQVERFLRTVGNNIQKPEAAPGRELIAYKVHRPDLIDASRQTLTMAPDCLAEATMHDHDNFHFSLRLD